MADAGLRPRYVGIEISVSDKVTRGKRCVLKARHNLAQGFNPGKTRTQW